MRVYYRIFQMSTIRTQSATNAALTLYNVLLMRELLLGEPESVMIEEAPSKIHLDQNDKPLKKFRKPRLRVKVN